MEQNNIDQNKKNPGVSALAAAFPHTLPVLTGFLVLGIAYGMLMQKNGYGVQWAVLMSAIAFCGSMQFIAITLLTTVFHPLEAFLLSLLVNARHLFYGLSMLEKYKGFGKVKALLIYTLCDETFSIVSCVEPPEGVDRKRFYLSVSLLDYGYWVFGTFLGGIAGTYISFNTKGLDFALTALFVVLFLEQMKKPEQRVFGVIGIAATVLGLVIFGANQMVLPSMGLVLLALLVGRKWLCR